MVRAKLIEYRGKRSRQEVAKDLDITPQMLGAIERGDRNPSLKLAKKIADYYGATVDEIFLIKTDTICVLTIKRRLVDASITKNLRFQRETREDSGDQ